jgi:hypothetical protein
MEHYFEIPVNCEGSEQLLKGRLVTFGYDYKFYVVVKGEEHVFEKNEQGEFQVLHNSLEHTKNMDAELAESIVLALQSYSFHK